MRWACRRAAATRGCARRSRAIRRRRPGSGGRRRRGDDAGVRATVAGDDGAGVSAAGEDAGVRATDGAPVTGLADRRRRGPSSRARGGLRGRIALVTTGAAGTPSAGVRESFSPAPRTPLPTRPSRAPTRRSGRVPAPSTMRAPRERSRPPRAMKRATRCSLVGSGIFSACGHRDQVALGASLLVAEQPLRGEVAHAARQPVGRPKRRAAAGDAARSPRDAGSGAWPAGDRGADGGGGGGGGGAGAARRPARAASTRPGAWAGATRRPRARAHGRRGARRCGGRRRAAPCAPAGGAGWSRGESRRP